MLKIVGANKRFGQTQALSNVGFSCAAGSITAVIGPNGAGKSTLFGCVAQVLKPDSGNFILDDADLTSLPPSELSYLPEMPFFYPSFTPKEMLCFENTMRDTKVSDSEIDELLASFGIGDYRNSKMSSLSQGMAKRVALAAAFMGQPRVLVLDEPLNGLDVQTVIKFKDKLLRFRKQDNNRGCHILISSHVLDFLNNVADTVIFLEGGEVKRVINGNDLDVEEEYIKTFMSTMPSS